MQTINASEIQVNDTLVPSGQKVVAAKLVKRGGRHGDIVNLTIRGRHGVTPLSFYANERLTVRR